MEILSSEDNADTVIEIQRINHYSNGRGFSRTSLTSLFSTRAELLAKSINEAIDKDFWDKLVSCLSLRGVKVDYSSILALKGEGIPARVLRPGQQWVSGKLKLKIVIEFEPELKEEGEPKPDSDNSLLNDLRQII